MPTSPSSAKLLPYRERPRRRYDLSFKHKLVRQTYETHAPEFDSLNPFFSLNGLTARVLLVFETFFCNGTF